jgi:hypothetical protein
MMHFCHFLFSDHCAILELGYLKSGKIAYPELVIFQAFQINGLLLYVTEYGISKDQKITMGKSECQWLSPENSLFFYFVILLLP